MQTIDHNVSATWRLWRNASGSFGRAYFLPTSQNIAMATWGPTQNKCQSWAWSVKCCTGLAANCPLLVYLPSNPDIQHTWKAVPNCTHSNSRGVIWEIYMWRTTTLPSSTTNYSPTPSSIFEAPDVEESKRPALPGHTWGLREKLKRHGQPGIRLTWEGTACQLAQEGAVPCVWHCMLSFWSNLTAPPSSSLSGRPHHPSAVPSSSLWSPSP